MYDHFLILKHSFKTTWTLSEDVCVQNKNKKHKDHHNNNMSKFNFNPSLHMLLVYYAEWSQDGADFSLQSGRDTDQTENWEWKSESYTRPVQIQIYIYIYIYYIYIHAHFFFQSLITDWQLAVFTQQNQTGRSNQNENLTQDQSKYRNIYIDTCTFFLSFSFNLKLLIDSMLSSLNKTKLAGQSKKTKIMALSSFFLQTKIKALSSFLVFLVFFFKKRKVYEQQFAGFFIAQRYRALPSVMTGCVAATFTFGTGQRDHIPCGSFN